MPRRASEKPSSFPRIPGYHIESVLGRGSMATVYKAVQVGMDRPVALKVLRDDVAGEPKIVRRLMREARLAARLNHPHVVRAHDAGVSNDGACYFVMEYIDGASVRDILMRRGKLDQGRAIDVAIEVAEALFAFYRQHIVHRDVKPANIMIDREGNALLADLGLAKIEFDSSMTSQNRAVGTPAYMSPEQARDPDNVDARSDVFSLGATLYHMVTGVSPFDAPTVGAVVTKILYDEPPPIRDVDPDLSPDLERVVGRMIEKDRNARYETPGALLRDLRALRRGAELPAAPPPEKGRKATVIAASGAALAVVAVIVFMVTRGSSDGRDGADGGREEDRVEELAPAGELNTPDLLRAVSDDAPRTHVDELEKRARAAMARVFERPRALAEARRFTEARRFIEERASGAFAVELGVRFADLPASLRSIFVEEQMAAGLIVGRIDDEWQDGIVDAAAEAYREVARDIAAAEEFLLEEKVRARIGATPIENLEALDARNEERVGRALDDAVAGLLSIWRDRFENSLSEIRALRDSGRLASARRAVSVERSRAPERLGGGLTDRLDAAESRIDEAEQELRRLLGNRLARIDRIPDDGHRELAMRDTSRLLAAIMETVARLPDDLDELTLAAAEARLLVELQGVVATAHRLLTELDTAPGARPGTRVTLETIDGDVHADVRIASVAVDLVRVVGRGGPRPIEIHARRLTPASLYALFGLREEDNRLVTALLCYCDDELTAAEAVLAAAAGTPAARFLSRRVDEALSHFEKVSTPEGKAALAKWRESLIAARANRWTDSFAAVKELVTTRAWETTEWYAENREKIRAHYDLAAAHSRLEATLGDRGGAWSVEDAAAGLVTGFYEFASPLEAKGLGLPGEHVIEGGHLVRTKRDRSVAPDRTGAVEIELPLDLERDSADIRFRYVPSPDPELAPRCLTIGIGGHHVAFLSRLLGAGGSAHLPLHGLERDVVGLAEFGRVAYWKGDVSGYEAALRAASGTTGFAFEAGKAYDVRLVVDPVSRRIIASVDGKAVLESSVRDLSASSDLVTLRAPMPHSIDSLRVRGAVRVED